MDEPNPARVTRNMSTLAQHEEPRPAALKKTASFADLSEPEEEEEEPVRSATAPA